MMLRGLENKAGGLDQTGESTKRGGGKSPPGNRWTLLGLLEEMEIHREVGHDMIISAGGLVETW